MQQFVNSMGLALGLIHVQLFLQLILLLDIKNWGVLPYYLNYSHWLIVQTVLPFTACRYSSRYFRKAANEPEVSPIGLLLR